MLADDLGVPFQGLERNAVLRLVEPLLKPPADRQLAGVRDHALVYCPE